MPAAMPRKEVIGGANTEGLPFSEAIRLGNLVFVSGNVGFDESGKIVPGGVGPETRQTFANIEKVLKEAGCSLADVVKVSVVLADPNDFDGYNAVYRTLFTHEPPARVTSPVPSTSSPSRAASRNSQPNDTVTAGPSRIGEAIANRQ